MLSAVIPSELSYRAMPLAGTTRTPEVRSFRSSRRLSSRISTSPDYIFTPIILRGPTYYSGLDFLLTRYPGPTSRRTKVVTGSIPKSLATLFSFSSFSSHSSRLESRELYQSVCHNPIFAAFSFSEFGLLSIMPWLGSF